MRRNVVKRLILLPLICLFRRFVNETQQQSSVLYNRLNEQWLFVQHGCQTGCQTLLTTGLTTGWMFVYTIQPVVKPVVQTAVSCKRGIKVTSGSVSVV